jgi:cytochrome c biogenesis protein
LADAELRTQAVRRYAAQATDPSKAGLADQLAASAGQALALFAGDPQAGGKGAGLAALSEYLEARVPDAERNRAGEVIVRILGGVLFELNQLARAKAGLQPLQPSEKTQAFMAQAVMALGDVHLYPAPMAFQLKDFTQVQASVFQVALAPGRNVVYLGCALLIIGIFAMLYVRERRLWVWLAPGGAGSQASLALSSNRQTLEVDREFTRLRTQLLGAPLTPPPRPSPSTKVSWPGASRWTGGSRCWCWPAGCSRSPATRSTWTGTKRASCSAPSRPRCGSGGSGGRCRC